MTDPPPSISIVIPVFNDWLAVEELLRNLDRELRNGGLRAAVLLADDASTEPQTELTRRADMQGGLARIEILRLRRNLGHQRAIAVALAFVEDHATPDFVVVMDGDGEDRPSDVPLLLRAAASGNSVVFAERTRRSEGWLFAGLYHAYRLLHLALTGVAVRVGNFSVLRRAHLRRLVGVSDLWNHYAAAVFKSRIPYMTVPTARGTRYSGRSQMNYAALVSHGLSAMAAFSDRLGVRLLAVTVLLAALVVVSGAASLLSYGGRQALGVWLPFAVSMTALLLFQGVAITLTFVFVILGRRDTSAFLPLRDYRDYVLECEIITDGANDQVPLRR